MAIVHKAGKKNRKYGRMKTWCEHYRARGQREKNKAIVLLKHLAKFPGDRKAKAFLEKIGGSRKAAS